MKASTLNKRILTAFTSIIVLLSVCILGLGFYVLQKEIFSRTQQQVEQSLDSARTFYEEEINRIGVLLEVAELDAPPERLMKLLQLDYFCRIPFEQAPGVNSEIVREAAESKQSLGGTRIIDKAELEAINGQVRQRCLIEIRDTPKARPNTRDVLESAMAKEYALLVRGQDGQVKEVVYGGRIINRDNHLVDRIRKLVYGDELYHDKPIGTVTIFQDDVRISTNVLDAEGRRAIGTRVSEEVYNEVVVKGNRWLDRAFVVTHWYKTAYEPIYSINGEILGVLYVGILESPSNDMLTKILIVFALVIVLASGLAFSLAVILSGAIVNPVAELSTVAHKMACGQLGLEVRSQTAIQEMDQLAESFNDMSRRIRDRENSLEQSNEKLADLNKSYLDLLGFVAHELKGLLASAVMNAYSLRDGFLGLINFKQKKAVDSICRNLDYLDATVRKFLNLSRIERGNMQINKTVFLLGPGIFDVSIQTFLKFLQTRDMTIENRINPELTVNADMDLMQIVANNLVNNAIKYGTENGRIYVSARDDGKMIEVEVYNDSRPIPKAMMDQLFKKFSRLEVPETKKVKGTGLGLYITKQIIESHGGSIRVEPRDQGNSFIFKIDKE